MDIDDSLNFDFENTFNAEEYLYFYNDYLTAEKLKSEIDFLVKFTALDRPLEILDLACGHGRHANALAQSGHKVTGIDITEDFLKIARGNALKLSVQVKYIHKDMRTINYRDAFDRIFMLYTSVGYFDDEQNEKVFRAIFKALKPNGFFCFDSHNRDTFMHYFLPTSVVEREGNFMIDRRSFDPLQGRSTTKRTIIYNQTTKNFQFSIRIYSPTEIIKLFQQIGFSNVAFYENWEGKPLGNESKRMIVIAKK